MTHARGHRFDPPDLGTITPQLTGADLAQLQALERYLQQCAVEYLARVNDSEPWTVYEGGPLDWHVDEAADAGPVVLVREPDGLRAEVDVTVAVAVQRTDRRGKMPDDGWPVEPSTTIEDDQEGTA